MTDWKAEADRLIAERDAPDRRLQPSAVFEAVCQLHRVMPGEVLGRGRNEQLLDARATFVGVCREATTASLPDLGECLGRAHSTIVNSLRRWKMRGSDLREKDTKAVRAIVQHGRNQP
jgi:chromosomal replication initiation ATPase DnaA